MTYREPSYDWQVEEERYIRAPQEEEWQRYHDEQRQEEEQRQEDRQRNDYNYRKSDGRWTETQEKTKMRRRSKSRRRRGDGEDGSSAEESEAEEDIERGRGRRSKSRGRGKTVSQWNVPALVHPSAHLAPDPNTSLLNHVDMKHMVPHRASFLRLEHDAARLSERIVVPQVVTPWPEFRMQRLQPDRGELTLSFWNYAAQGYTCSDFRLALVEARTWVTNGSDWRMKMADTPDGRRLVVEKGF